MEVNFTYMHQDYDALISSMNTNSKFAKCSWIFLPVVIVINIVMSGLFVGWISKVQAYVVPKRSFANAEEIESFKHRVAAKMTNQELLK